MIKKKSYYNWIKWHNIENLKKYLKKKKLKLFYGRQKADLTTMKSTST